MVDWNRFNQELRNVVDTGKIVYGTNNVKKECLIGDPKLLILSSTVSKDTKELLLYYAKLLNIEAIEYPENSLELGSVCAKPFSISTIALIDLGRSSIEEALKAEDGGSKKKVIAKRVKKEERRARKAEKEKKEQKEQRVKKASEEKVEDKEVPITEDEFFKDMIKIRKR